MSISLPPPSQHDGNDVFVDVENAGAASDTTAMDGETAEAESHNESTTVVLNFETLRSVACTNIVLVVFIGVVLTSLFINIPLEETEMCRLFGFNHSCNFLDHHPAREVSAILVVAFIMPMALFLVGACFLSRNACLRGEVPRWFWIHVKIVTPFNVLAVSLFHVVFVDPPDQDCGFVAHCIPCFCLKLAWGFVAIQQSFCLVFGQRWMETRKGGSTLESRNIVPFRLKLIWAKICVGQTVVAALARVTMMFTVASGNPMLDTANCTTHRLIGVAIMHCCTVVALILLIGFAAWEQKHTPDSAIAVAQDVDCLSFSGNEDWDSEQQIVTFSCSTSLPPPPQHPKLFHSMIHEQVFLHKRCMTSRH